MNDALKMLDDLIVDYHKSITKRTTEEAKANPKAYRDTNVMESGSSYRYYELRGLPRGKRMLFCRSTKRNVAGYFVTFIEVHNGKNGKRVAFKGWVTKRDAKEYARARYQDALKPKAERKWTLPSFVCHKLVY